jgi:outer membrane murein-binding lipoprotein Lpp
MRYPNRRPEALLIPFSIEPRGLSLPLFFCLTVFLLAGCATKGDIDQVKQELQSSFNSQVEGVKADTHQTKAKLSEAMVRSESLERESAELRSSVKSSVKIFGEYLRAEENQLKERLRSVQSLLRSLDEGVPKDAVIK